MIPGNRKPAPDGRRGVSLALAIAMVLLVECSSAMLVGVTLTRIHQSADARLAVEAQLVTASALARARVANAATFAQLADGETRSLPGEWRTDGWRSVAAAMRVGSVIRLTVTVTLNGPAGTPRARRTGTLLLVRKGADTVHVVAHQPRF